MLEITNVRTAGSEPALRGMRNPKNSWERSDSVLDMSIFYDGDERLDMGPTKIGPNDLTLANTLADGGPVHAKYRRMIVVWLDINAPLYWWKEFDTYKVGTVANSCSTMHKIHAKEFTLDDFSHDHLFSFRALDEIDMEDFPLVPLIEETSVNCSPMGVLKLTVEMLNACREKYLAYCERPTKDLEKHKRIKKKLWWQMIQLLPSCYNQKRTVMLSYEVLANIYKWRRNHKLDEWHVFCDWIETLPYSELITGKR